MALFATMTYDDDDPDLHVHMTRRARDLEDHNPAELVRVLVTMEQSLTAQAVKVARVRAIIEDRMTTQDQDRRAAQ